MPVIVVAALVVVALAPVASLLVDTFTEDENGLATALHMANWSEGLSNNAVWKALGMTLLLTLATEVIALPVGVGITWLVTRTNVAPRRVLDLLIWITFFLPALPVINGWILLTDPSYGLLNDLLAPLARGGEGPLNIYSFWGIVWIHLVTKSISAKYILLAPTFERMDTSLEEASTLCGAPPRRTMRRITLPVLMPAIAMTAVLSAIYAIESFETELILGSPAGIEVYSTRLYGLAHQTPPNFAQAKVLGLTALALITPMIILYQRFAGSRAVPFQTGRARVERRRLSKPSRVGWSAALLLFTAVCTILPLALLVMGTFMRLFGFFEIPDPWTTDNWQLIFENVRLRSALMTTVKLGLGVAVIGTALYTIIAFTILRARSRLGRAADFFSWLPVALPGLIFGLGLLSVVVQTPLLRSLYGSSWVLLLALVVAAMTTGVQVLRTNLAQQHPELEEASAMCGATRARTVGRITLRLMASAIVTVAIVSFATATSNVAHVVMLSSGGNEPLSTLQLQYLTTGEYEAAAVVGTIIVGMSVTFAILSRAIATRWENRRPAL